LEPNELKRFEVIVLPQLDAAYTLARHLTRNDHDAEDIVQEASLRALKYFSGFRGAEPGDARAWLLTIVRNTAYTWQRRHRASAQATQFDEELHSDAVAGDHPAAGPGEETAIESLHQALDRLPPEFREVIVLRELEGLSYREIGDVTGVPAGTVMSRLSRARRRLQEALCGQQGG
jgi:RNA polymerase sigma-70 factor (ECF subfamily)